MYQLISYNGEPASISLDELTFIPLDYANKEFRAYYAKVKNSEIEDILPEGMLDEIYQRYIDNN